MLLEYIKNIPNGAYITLGISIIVYVIRSVVNNWGITELERLKLSNFKKFQISLIRYSIYATFLIFFVFLILVKTGKYSLNEITQVMIFLFIICIIAMFISEYLGIFIYSIISFKYNYYVVDEQGNLLYKIIKLSGSNQYQVESEDKMGFINVNNCIWYKKIRGENYIRRKIYNSAWIKKANMVSLIVCCILYIAIYFISSWMQLTLFLITNLILYTTIVSIITYSENKSYHEH